MCLPFSVVCVWLPLLDIRGKPWLSHLGGKPLNFYFSWQVLKVQPNLWPFLLQSEGADEEHFADVEEEGEGDLKGHVVAGGCVGGYLINGRNPLYCRADTSCLWELARLQSHYHPSVQAFATKIAQVMQYSCVYLYRVCSTHVCTCIGCAVLVCVLV